MAKEILGNKWTWVILALIGIFLVGMLSQKNYDLFTISGSETMTRTSSASTVSPGSTFTLTYTASGTSGSWGASIVDNSAGGCTFPSGSNTYKSVMLSEDGLTKTLTLTAPQSGTCTFTGDYQFGSTTIKNLNSLSVTICSKSCVRPANLCTATSSDNCGGTCTWTVTKNTAADTDCNNQVSRTEIGTAITQWTNSQLTRAELGSAIQAWAST